jgi:DNA-binding NarL/FixJ family response regulator
VGLFYNVDGITAVVEDNGRGFDAAAQRGAAGPSSSARLGLHGMAARAHYLRGELSIDSTQGWGTSVRAEVPYSGSGEVSRERWKVLVAGVQPLVRAGLVRLLETSEPSVQVMGEPGSLEDLVESISLLQPDMVVLDWPLLEQYSAALRAGAAGDSVDRPVVAIVEQPTLDQLRLAAASGVRGFLSPASTPAEVARVVVAAARGDALLDGAVFTRFTEAHGNAAPGENTAARLTARELEVRDLLGQGLADKQIATRLAISVKTVEKHVGAMLRKTGARNRTMLAGLTHQGR